MAIFGNAKEAEEKYLALQSENEALLANIKELEEKLGTIESVDVDSITAAVKGDVVERLTLAVESGLAHKSVMDIVKAESIKDAAILTVKAMKSDGATVSSGSDIEGKDFVESDPDDAMVEGVISKTFGKGK